MRKHLLFPCLFLFTVACWAEPAVPAAQFVWPDTPVPVRLISVPVDCGWRAGRPFVSREKVARLLKLDPQGAEADIDLGEALSQQGWLVQTEADGSIVAKPPGATSVGGAVGISAPVRETPESRQAVRNFVEICARENKTWVRNHPKQELLNAVGQQLAQQARRPVPWTFAIVEEGQPNAACTGEGMVYITTSLLNLLDVDELAGVLSHEIAHGARQQLAEDQVERGRVRQTVSDARALEERYRKAALEAQREYYRDRVGGVREGDASSRLNQALASARDRYNFSMRTVKERARAHANYQEFKPKTDERQADLVGMRLASAAGYRADGLLRALEKLQAAKYRNFGQQKMLGSSTHPPLQERIDTLRELLRRSEAGR